MMAATYYSTLGDKRFGIYTPRDLLLKLSWEIQNLNDPSMGITAEGYHCFNAAVTAWHLTDWVWKAFHQQQFKKVSDFQSVIRKESKHLAICDQLANGSKHFERDVHDRPEVYSNIEPAAAIIRTPDGRLQLRTQPSIFVYDGPDKMVPDALFSAAHRFWSAHISECEQRQKVTFL